MVVFEEWQANLVMSRHQSWQNNDEECLVMKPLIGKSRPARQHGVPVHAVAVVMVLFGLFSRVAQASNNVVKFGL